MNLLRKPKSLPNDMKSSKSVDGKQFEKLRLKTNLNLLLRRLLIPDFLYNYSGKHSTFDQVHSTTTVIEKFPKEKLGYSAVFLDVAQVLDRVD